MTDGPGASNCLPSGVYAAGQCFHCGNWIWSWDAQGVVPWRSAPPAPLRPQGLVIRGGCNVVATERVNFLFADGQALYGDALEMLAQGKIRKRGREGVGGHQAGYHPAHRPRRAAFAGGNGKHPEGHLHRPLLTIALPGKQTKVIPVY